MPKEIKPPETQIDSRSGDKPAETPGHVIPGMDLRKRMGAAYSERSGLAPNPDAAKKEHKLPPDAPVAAALPPKDEKTGKFVKKPKAPAPMAAVDPEALSAAVVAGIKAAQPKEAPAPAPPDPLEGLKPAQKRKFAVLTQMGETGGDKNLAKRWLETERKMATYKSEWEAKNKGKKFDIADPEHDEFVTANDVPYDLDEFADAEHALIEKRASELADDRAKAALKPLEEKIKLAEDTQAEQKRVAELIPQVKLHSAAIAKVLFSQLGDEYKKVIGEDGKPVQSELNRLNSENPVNRQVFDLAQQAELVASELKKIHFGLTKFRENPPARSAFKTKEEFNAELQTYLLHTDIAEFAIEQDAEMAKNPEEERLNQDGKMFATMGEWNKLTEKQRESRWYLTDADLSVFFAIKQAKEAKRILAAKKPDAPAPAPPAPSRPERPERPAYARQPEERSPSGAVGSIAPKTAQVANVKQTARNTLLSRMVG